MKTDNIYILFDCLSFCFTDLVLFLLAYVQLRKVTYVKVADTSNSMVSGHN